MRNKFPVNPTIGTVAPADPIIASFTAFGQEWKFAVPNQAAANIAKSCLTYYKPLWDGTIPEQLDKSDVVLDIGAHVGFFSIPIASQVDSVLSYEPAPANFELLKRNIWLNRMRNVGAYHLAVGDKVGNVSLSLGVQGSTGHSIVTHKKGGVTVTVPCTTLAAVLRSFNYEVSILKLDCEGAEWYILKEDNMRLLKNIRAIVAEMHFVKRNNLPAVVSNLQHAGFKVETKNNSWFSKLVAWR